MTRNGAINIRTCGFSKDQAQTVRMIIKNQNVLHVLASGRICCRKRCRLPNDENPFRVDARLSTRKRISRETRFPIGDGPNEGCRKEHSSMVRAFPFHEARYDRLPCRRYGACVGFCGVPCEAILVPSFEVDPSSLTNAEDDPL